MKKVHILPAAMLGLALAVPAMAEEKVSAETQSKTTVEKDASGNYRQEQSRAAESTDAAGTTTKSETKVEVKADPEGNSEKKVTTETSVDPEGLMNKSKTVTTDSVKYKDGKIEKKYKKKVDGKTVEENMEETSTN